MNQRKEKVKTINFIEQLVIFIDCMIRAERLLFMSWPSTRGGSGGIRAGPARAGGAVTAYTARAGGRVGRRAKHGAVTAANWRLLNSRSLCPFWQTAEAGILRICTIMLAKERNHGST